MNTVVVGLDKAPILDHLPEEFLIIDDGPIIDQLDIRARRFDVEKHAFNPLRDMDYQRARAFLDVLNGVFPEGENTLTRRYSNFVLLNALLDSPPRLDRLIPAPDKKDTASLDAYQKIQTLLLSPVLKRVLDQDLSFSFEGTITVRIDRAQIGDFDAFVLGNLIVSQYRGPVVIPDFGFYSCPFHVGLIRQERLVAGITSFAEVPRYRDQMLLFGRKVPSRCTPEDAKVLALYEGIPPGTNAYSDFVDAAIGTAA